MGWTRRLAALIRPEPWCELSGASGVVTSDFNDDHDSNTRILVDLDLAGHIVIKTSGLPPFAGPVAGHRAVSD